MRNKLAFISIMIAANFCSFGQTTNQIFIETAIALRNQTEEGYAYMIEESTNMVTWSDSLSDWILGNGETTVYYTSPTQSHQYYRCITAERPLVSGSTPVSGSTNVDPNLNQIIINFPVDMLSTGTFGPSSANGEMPPWDSTARPDNRTFILNVNLEANTQYALWINPPQVSMPKFKTTDGIPVMPFLLTFTTQ